MKVIQIVPIFQTNIYVLNFTQEIEFFTYIKTSSDLNYGLNDHQIRTIAYQFAKAVGGKVPST